MQENMQLDITDHPPMAEGLTISGLQSGQVSYDQPPSQLPRASESERRATAKVAELLSNAKLLFRHQEDEMGFALLRTALNSRSDHPEAIRMLAHFQIGKKRFDQAEKGYRQLLNVDYGFENLISLADCIYRQGRDSEALERYDEAFSVLTPGYNNEKVLFEAYKNLGNIHCRLGDYQAAEENYFRAFTLNPKSDVLLVNLGTLEFQRSENSLALEKFRQAIELNPQNDKAWVGLALVHDRMGDSVLALANIENAVDLSPENRTAVHILANWMVRERRYETAIEALENYLAKLDQDEEMSLVLIHIFCLCRQFNLARLEIERVLLWNPKNEAVLNLLQEFNKHS